MKNKLILLFLLGLIVPANIFSSDLGLPDYELKSSSGVHQPDMDTKHSASLSTLIETGIQTVTCKNIKNGKTCGAHLWGNGNTQIITCLKCDYYFGRINKTYANIGLSFIVLATWWYKQEYFKDRACVLMDSVFGKYAPTSN